MNPKAREEGLLVRELPGETLVYELAGDKAHCLNRTAALVWQSCDGKTTVAEMVSRLRKQDLPASEELVWLALDRLEKARLLEEPVLRPPAAVGVSRRQVMRKLGIAGGLSLLLPVVTSIVAPAPAMADSAQVVLAPCTTGDPPFCFCPSGVCRNGLASNCVTNSKGVCTPGGIG